MTVEEITQEALKLPEAERGRLADELFASLEDGDESPEFVAMLKRRIEEIDSGKVQTIPWKETKAKMDAILNAKRKNASGGRG